MAREKDRFCVCIEDSDVGVSGELGKEPYRSECSKGMSCFADTHLNIFISSSVCAELLLDHDSLAGFGVEPHDLGLPNVYPEAYLLTAFMQSGGLALDVCMCSWDQSRVISKIEILQLFKRVPLQPCPLTVH